MILKKILLIFFGLFFCLFLLEVSLQIAGFLLSYTQERRNMQRLPETKTYRIVCIGESTTACGGADSYPSQLEDILNRKKLGISFDIVNKGIFGGFSNDILAQIERNIDDYKPSMVIAMMGINDSNEYMFKHLNRSAGKLWLNRFKTYRLAMIVLNHIRQDNEKLPLAIDYKKQEKVLRAKQLLESQNDGIIFELGKVYVHLGDLAKAEELFYKCLKINPKHDGSYIALGDLYQTQRKHEKALEMYNQAISLIPNNPNIYVKAGWNYNGRKLFDKAAEVLKKAIEIDAYCYRAYLVLGRFYNDRKWFKQSEEIYKIALKIFPNRNEAYYELGEMYYSQQQDNKIKKLLALAFEQNPVINVSALNRMINKQDHALKSDSYNSLTLDNYLKLKYILKQQGLKLVCVQYPLRSIQQLKDMLGVGIIYVDNQLVFEQAVKISGYAEYFDDMFAGDFGHCNKKGNRLLAENIANTVAAHIKKIKLKDK